MEAEVVFLEGGFFVGDLELEGFELVDAGDVGGA